MLGRLDQLGALRFIAWGLHWPEQAATWFARAPVTDLPPSEQNSVYLALWLFAQTEEVRTAALHYLRPDNHTQATVLGLVEVWGKIQRADWSENTPPSHVAQLLLPYKERLPLLRALTAVAEPHTPTHHHLTQYVTFWRHITPAVNGDTLRQLGVPPGPVYRELLTAVWHAKLDGQLPTPADEHTYLRQLLSQK
jgi:hypothetical protein